MSRLQQQSGRSLTRTADEDMLADEREDARPTGLRAITLLQGREEPGSVAREDAPLLGNATRRSVRKWRDSRSWLFVLIGAVHLVGGALELVQAVTLQENVLVPVLVLCAWVCCP